MQAALILNSSCCLQKRLVSVENTVPRIRQAVSLQTSQSAHSFRRKCCRQNLTTCASTGDVEAQETSVPSANPSGSENLGPIEGSSRSFRTQVPGADVQKKGRFISDYLSLYGGLLERGGSGGESMAAAGSIAIERCKKDAEALYAEGGVEEQVFFELQRSLQLLSMDMKLIAAAKKEDTMYERLEVAKGNLKLAITMAELL